MEHFSRVAAALLVVLLTSGPVLAQTAPATGAFERLKSLEGNWIDVDGAFGTKGAVAVTYRVTGGGTTVVETFPVATPGEMVTVYHQDGSDLVLTHYCSAGNQPRMRAKQLSGNTLAFDYDGGTNVDPAKTSHMHSVTIEFLTADEVRATWQNWRNGKSTEKPGVFRIARKK